MTPEIKCILSIMLLHHFCSILIILSIFPGGQTESSVDSSEYIEALDHEIDADDGGPEGKLQVKGI